MSINLFRYISVIALTLILYVIQYQVLQPPEVVPASASQNEFSAERAYRVLEKLLEENQPHPVGSPLNKIVKQRIIDELNRYDIESSEQHSWACATRYNGCAFVENIIATIPGELDSPYITLMSHYDSVPMAPGAGDDGAAVAAMLETARILKSEAPFKHPILLLFTDAEEMGLIGAEAFYKQHPLADQIGVVLDYEGSGTTGVSMVLRATLQNEKLMNLYQEESSRPIGFSLANELFKRMPNDTDFSVVQRANIPGIDFAFAGERNHYHTPNDNTANIDIRTIQHHGENMLPLARRLATEGLQEPGSHHVFANFYAVWIQWDGIFSGFLLLASTLLIFFGFVRLGAGMVGTGLATLGSLAIMLVTTLICFLSFEVIAHLNGTVVAWPANDLPYRIALASSALTGGLGGMIVCNRYLKHTDVLIGTWLFWLILSLLMVIFLPDAANTLLVPTLSASLIIAMSTLLDEKSRNLLLIFTLVMVIPATLGMVLPMEESQGYRLIAATFIFLGLFNTALTPLLHGARLRGPLLASIVSTVIAVANAAINPLYSEWRPQHLNINYFENLDNGEAFYQLESQNPAPERLMSLMQFKVDKAQLLPFHEAGLPNWSPADTSGLPGPEISIQDIKPAMESQTISLVIQSPRQANAMMLIFPSESKLKNFSIEGNAFDAILLDEDTDRSRYLIRLVNVYDRKIPMELTFETTQTISFYLADGSTKLPDSASELLAERTPLASPVHQGDQAMLFRQFDLKPEEPE